MGLTRSNAKEFARKNVRVNAVSPAAAGTRALEGLEDRFVELLAIHGDVSRLKVYLGGVGRVDLSGALALRRIVQDARSAGLEVELVDVPPRARRWVRTLIEPDVDPIETTKD